MRIERPIWLASASPRRRHLLGQAGIDCSVMPADIDEAAVERGDDAVDAWAVRVAQAKAHAVATRLGQAGHNGGTVLAADTVCCHDGIVYGKPASPEEARAMLRTMRSAAHQTITGVCILRLRDGYEYAFADAARVELGDVTDEQIKQYIAGGAWRGKAGGYNLAERIDAGWPIACHGDPATVMGLPMQRLCEMLAGAACTKRAGV